MRIKISANRANRIPDDHRQKVLAAIGYFGHRASLPFGRLWAIS
jgi:hypothetical protein